MGILLPFIYDGCTGCAFRHPGGAAALSLKSGQNSVKRNRLAGSEALSQKSGPVPDFCTIVALR